MQDNTRVTNAANQNGGFLEGQRDARNRALALSARGSASDHVLAQERMRRAPFHIFPSSPKQVTGMPHILIIHPLANLRLDFHAQRSRDQAWDDIGDFGALEGKEGGKTGKGPL